MPTSRDHVELLVLVVEGLDVKDREPFLRRLNPRLREEVEMHLPLEREPVSIDALDVIVGPPAILHESLHWR